MNPPSQKDPYIGSVRFFKHIFLSIILAMMIIPSILAIIFGIRLSGANDREQDLQLQVNNLTTMVESLQAQLQAESETLYGPDDVDSPDYSQLYPDFYAPEANYSSVVKENVCYLTFDDGPSVRTDEILDVLDQTDAKVTFFVTKQNTEADRARLKRAADAGHTIGMHTTTHDYKLIYTDVEAFLNDYYELYSWIIEVTGQAPTIFRFPGGSINAYNRSVYQEIIAEMSRRGFVFFDWNVSSEDAAGAKKTSAEITANCLRGLEKPRAIVLMHDSASKTATALAVPEIIAGYQAAGYTLEGLSSEVKPVIFSYR